MANPIRFVKEIGLYAFSRGATTCKWQTEWCEQQCYNRKFYRINPKLGDVDEADNAYWHTTHEADIAGMIRLLDVKRFRFAVRGEIWLCLKDVQKVAGIMRRLPEVLFWIPTRAWRGSLKGPIELAFLHAPNARVMASIDPTVSGYTEKALVRDGWSLVFAGDNSDPRQLLLSTGGVEEKRTARYHKCVKTWDHDTGYCAECASGCFSKERVDVHLKQHR